LYLGSRFTVGAMDIAVPYFDGCPSWKVADERLRAIAADRPDITVRHAGPAPHRFMRAPHHQDPHLVADADPGKDS